MNYLSWHDEDYQELAQRAGSLPHALLFHGPVGIGKLAFAQSLARRLLCENAGSGVQACGKCSACHWFDNGSHPDFRLVEPEGASDSGEPDEGEDAADSGKDKKKKRWIAVSQIRTLEDFVNITSHRGGLKVIVIHPAETMNVNAANALLKSLEEPPPGTHFLLVSHRPDMLLPTIKSRCQQIALPVPNAATVAQWLREQGAENADLASAQAGGLPLLAARYDEKYWDERKQFLDGLAARSYEPLTLAERIAALPVAQVVGWLQKWTYDLMSLKFLDTIRYNPDYRPALAAAAGAVNDIAMLRYHRELVRLQRVVEHPFNARLLFEDLLLAYGRLTRAARR